MINATKPIIFITLTSAFHAAAAFAEPSATISDSDASLVNEIVVTTSRSQTPLKDNAGNIAVLPTQDLPSLYPSDLLNRAPGVAIHRGNGQEHLTSIRSPILTGGAGAGSFLFMEDGIAFRAAGFANVNALMDSMSFDTQRVEVIRGPGSALYGSNAVHGLVNFITRDPSDDGQTIEATYGSYGRYALRGATSLAHDNGSTRIAASVSGEDNAYRTDSGFAQQKLRIQHGWETTRARYKATLSGMSLNQETAGYIEGTNAYEDRDLAKQNSDADDAFRDAWSMRASLRIDYQTQNGNTLSLTPYLRSNAMRFGQHFLPGDPIEENEHTSIGLLSAYAMPAYSGLLTLGLDTEFTRGELTELQNKATVFGYEPGLHYDYEVEALVIAPFIHQVMDISEQTKVTLGLRAEFTRYDYNNKTDDGNFGTGNKFFRPSDRTDDYADISPKLGFTHTLNDKVTLFGNIARGNRAPQTTDAYRLRVGQTVGEVKSEALNSVETGIRVNDGNIRYSIATYVMEKRNYYFRDSSNNNVTNGQTRHMGIELDGAWVFAPKWTVSGAAAIASHKYNFNHTPVNNTRLENVIADGNQIDSAPKTIANLALAWQPRAETLTKVEFEHMGKYYADGANLRQYDGHDLLHFIWQETISTNTLLSLRINNLLNDKYAKRADFNGANGNDRYFPGEPRHVSLTFRRDF